ncbi:hypothetical protein [Dialister hominis]|jgi:hypothetical protein|uniref:hypothetical protein n=2 Tax=Dialister hominis TaxID=2582419 RepID=UPI003FD861FB
MSHTGKITAVLAGLAFLSGGLSASASDGMHYVAAENRFLGPEISCELSEEAGDTAVKTALIEGLEIPQKELSGTRWYYDYVDLSGTGGDTLVWLVSDGNGWKVHQTLTLVRSPVIAADLSGNGRKSLIVYRAGGGTRGMWVELDQVQQENDEYLFTTVNDGVKAPDLGTLKGTALFADDMILDQMTGSYKTLG